MKVAIYIRESGTRKYTPASPRGNYPTNTAFCLRYTLNCKRKWEQLEVQSYKEAHAVSLKRLSELITKTCEEKPTFSQHIQKTFNVQPPRPKLPTVTEELMLDAAIDRYLENIQKRSHHP